MSRATLDGYLKKIFKDLIKKKNKGILIDFEKFKILSRDIKMAVINESVKQLKKNYYELRSKKVTRLIQSLDIRNFKKSTLGGCIFFKKNNNLCLKLEKL